MTRLIARLDGWIHGFVPVTREGLAISRIIFASFYLLVGLPWFSWTSRNPPGFLVPSPLNIAAALSDFPSMAAMKTLDVLIGVCFICLLVGFRTRLVSIVLTLAWTFGNSLRFSFGKIDHEMIGVVTPMIMAFAGWGDFYSIDAGRRRGDAPAPRAWPLSLMAFLIAYGFLSAGVPKLATWIDFDLNTQGTRSWLMYVWTDGYRSLLVPFFVRINSRWFWEIADWIAVAFETSFIVSLVSLSAFRTFLFAAVGFHLMNLLMLNIGFYNFLPLYLIFAPWERVGSRTSSSTSRWLNRIGSPGMLAALLVLVLPLYALEARLTPNAPLSHVGVFADLTRAFDFPWDVSLVLHALSLPIALAFAGLPIGIALPGPDRAAFPIVFFDGHCNLCNSFVDFVMRHDRRRLIRFASLRSAIGRQVLLITRPARRSASERKTDDADGLLTIVLLDVDGYAYARSDAVLKITGYFGGPYRLLAVLWLVPRIVRDFLYRLVSRHRYAVFGQRMTCRVPTADEQSLFLEADRSSWPVASGQNAFDSAIEITP
jgi:predicted DCC family thiol-disulfide oxidoreductase YuxK